MASKLTRWINAKLKSKGLGVKEAKKDAGKYSSIAAAKRAGSLYYTNKAGKVMIAAYAEDLKTAPPPKKRPTTTTKKKKESAPPKRPTKNKTETKKINTVAKKPNSKTPDESSGGRPKVTSTTIIVKGRSEADKELDNLAKEIAKFRINRANRKSVDRQKIKAALKKAKEKAASQTNTQLRQMDTPFMESGDRYRLPGQGSGRGLRGTQPEEFTKKVKYKPRKAKGGLIDMRKKGLFK